MGAAQTYAQLSAPLSEASSADEVREAATSLAAAAVATAVARASGMHQHPSGMSPEMLKLNTAAAPLSAESTSPPRSRVPPSPKSKRTPRSSGQLKLNTKIAQLGGFRQPSARSGYSAKPDHVFVGNRTARGYATYRDPTSHVRNWFRFNSPAPKSSRTPRTPKGSAARTPRTPGGSVSRAPRTPKSSLQKSSRRKPEARGPQKSMDGLKGLDEIEQSAAVAVTITPRGTEVQAGGAKAKQKFFEQFIDWSSDQVA